MGDFISLSVSRLACMTAFWAGVRFEVIMRACRKDPQQDVENYIVLGLPFLTPRYSKIQKIVPCVRFR